MHNRNLRVKCNKPISIFLTILTRNERERHFVFCPPPPVLTTALDPTNAVRCPRSPCCLSPLPPWAWPFSGSPRGRGSHFCCSCACRNPGQATQVGLTPDIGGILRSSSLFPHCLHFHPHHCVVISSWPIYRLNPLDGYELEPGFCLHPGDSRAANCSPRTQSTAWAQSAVWLLCVTIPQAHACAHTQTPHKTRSPLVRCTLLSVISILFESQKGQHDGHEAVLCLHWLHLQLENHCPSPSPVWLGFCHMSAPYLRGVLILIAALQG